MERNTLEEYKRELEKLSDVEKKERDLYLRAISNNEIYGPMTGYASIDKPWLKYFTEEEIKAPLLNGNIYDIAFQNKEHLLNNIALHMYGVDITYKQLIEKINATADALYSMGIREGDFIVSTLPGTPESIYLIYAAAKIGACIDLIDPLVNPNLLKKYCDVTKPKLMFTLDAPNIAKSSLSILHKTTFKKIIMVNPANAAKDFLGAPLESSNYQDEDIINWQEFIKNNSIKAVKCDAKENRPLAVLHTGGTTGVPKGALLSHDNLNALATQMLNCPLDIKEGEIALNSMPPFAAYGICIGIHTHLTAGLTLILTPEYNPTQIVSQLLEYKPNRIACSPAHYEFIRDNLDLKENDLSFLHSSLMGGDRITPKLEQDINDLFLSRGSKAGINKAYGLTETSTSVSVCVNEETNKLSSSGIPLTKTQVGIFNFDNPNEEYPYGKPGEVAVISPNNMLGYYNMPEETSKMYKKHSDGSVWLHTGDIGYIDEDGVLFITGRLRRMIIQHSGLKANPFEAEVEILQHPLVKNAVVIGGKDPLHEQGCIPVAYVEVDNDTDVNSLQQDLINMCDEYVTYYSIPMDYVFVEKLPKTSRGKIDIMELEKQYNSMETRKLIRHRSLDIN